MKTFKRILKWAGVSLGVVVVLAGALLAHTWYFKPLDIDWFYNRTMIQFALDDPQTLSQLGILDGIGIRGHNAHLSDESDARGAAMFDKLREIRATLHRYDRSDYEGQDALSYDILDGMLEIGLEFERFRHHSYPMNQLFGFQSGLPNFMANVHRVPDELGAEHYISRLSEFERSLGQSLEGVKIRESKGIIPPTFVVEKVLDEMRRFKGTPPRENILFTALDEKLAELVEEGELTEDRRAELQIAAEAEIVETVYPAYGELIAYYETVLPKTAGNHGAWSLPDGDEAYELAIRFFTTTDMTADEIHNFGLAEVARIGAEMDAILVAQGLTEGTIGERVQQLGSDPAQLFEDSDAGREAILAEYTTIIEEISGGLDDWFDVRPEADVEVKRVPEFMEKTAPGAYYQRPSLDGERGGVFYANLRDVTEIPRFGMRTLAYHEGVPGHHFQIAIMQELEGLPIFRRMVPVTAYTEGWALYTERLAWEAGFQDDPLDNLGRLQAEMFRAVRLVVDTGMHAKRWTREQAIEFMLANTGMGEGDVVAEIERYLVIPGQALAYKIGMTKILELRERARAELGDAFDIKEFHNVVLTNGAVPLDVLERIVDDWIASKT